MKYPEGTTKEQWDRYYEDLARHEAYYAAKKPNPPETDNPEDLIAYKKAKAEWDMGYFCDAPNKPGYYRANND